MFEYRQVLTPMRLGDTNRAIARAGLLGRRKAAQLRLRPAPSRAHRSFASPHGASPGTPAPRASRPIREREREGD